MYHADYESDEELFLLFEKEWNAQVSATSHEMLSTTVLQQPRPIDPVTSYLLPRIYTLTDDAIQQSKCSSPPCSIQTKICTSCADSLQRRKRKNTEETNDNLVYPYPKRIRAMSDPVEMVDIKEGKKSSPPVKKCRRRKSIPSRPNTSWKPIRTSKCGRERSKNIVIPGKGSQMTVDSPQVTKSFAAIDFCEKSMDSSSTLLHQLGNLHVDSCSDDYIYFGAESQLSI